MAIESLSLAGNKRLQNLTKLTICNIFNHICIITLRQKSNLIALQTGIIQKQVVKTTFKSINTKQLLHKLSSTHTLPFICKKHPSVR